MKLRNILFALTVFVATITICFALDLRTSRVYTFTRVVDIPITTSHPYPFRLNSVVLGFATAQNNTFVIQLRRGAGAYRTIYTIPSSSYTTASWILEGTFNFTTNDVLRFSNSVNAQATLYYNYEI